MIAVNSLAINMELHNGWTNEQTNEYKYCSSHANKLSPPLSLSFSLSLSDAVAVQLAQTVIRYTKGVCVCLCETETETEPEPVHRIKFLLLHFIVIENFSLYRLSSVKMLSLDIEFQCVYIFSGPFHSIPSSQIIYLIYFIF